MQSCVILHRYPHSARFLAMSLEADLAVKHRNPQLIDIICVDSKENGCRLVNSTQKNDAKQKYLCRMVRCFAL